MRGHTKVQLFDANTGVLTDEIEKDNYVTENVKKWLGKYYAFQIASGYNFKTADLLDSSYIGYDFIRYFYGGVLIFDKSMESNSLFMDSDDYAHIIGHAGYASKADLSLDGGTFNSYESVFDGLNGKYKFVWDFDTAACNGDIASICLVPAYTGQNGLVDRVYPANSSYLNLPFIPNLRNSYRTFESSITTYDKENNISYTAVSVDGYKVNGRMYRGNIYDIDSFGSGLGELWIDNDSFSRARDEVDYSVIALDNVSGSGIARGAGGYEFFMYYYNESELTYKIRLCRPNLTYDDFEFNMTDILNEMSDFSGESKLSLFGYYCKSIRHFSIPDGMFLLPTINKNNVIRVYKLTESGYTYSEKALKITPAIIFASNWLKVGRYGNVYGVIVGQDGHYANEYPYSYRPYVLILDKDFNITDKFLLPFNNSFDLNSDYINNSDVPSLNHKDSDAVHMWLYNNRTYGNDINNDRSVASILRHDFLSTINNQSTVLTKTSDKTMKVTYTLTEV